MNRLYKLKMKKGQIKQILRMADRFRFNYRKDDIDECVQF